MANQILIEEIGKGMDPIQEKSAQAKRVQPEETEEAKREATRVSHHRSRTHPGIIPANRDKLVLSQGLAEDLACTVLPRQKMGLGLKSADIGCLPLSTSKSMCELISKVSQVPHLLWL